MENPGRECFVCLESTEPLLTGICACTERAVHLKCQQKMLRTSPRKQEGVQAFTTCPVCKVAYTNVTITMYHRPSPHGVVIVLAFVISALCLLAGGAEFCFYAMEEGTWEGTRILGAVFVTLSVLALAYGIIFYYRYRSAGLLVKNVRVRAS